MMLGARTAAWAKSETIPAIWIGIDTSYFDSEIPFGDGHVIVDIQFYRKTTPSAGQYVFGGFKNGRFDACVYTSSFWFVGYGSNSSNCLFSEGGELVYNKINRTIYDIDYNLRTISFSANGHDFLKNVGFSFSNSDFSPYIGARRQGSSSASEPSHDVGIISVDITKNGSPFRKYRPRVQNGVVGLFDEVNNVFHEPIFGGNNLTFITDITKDGVIV